MTIDLLLKTYQIIKKNYLVSDNFIIFKDENKKMKKGDYNWVFFLWFK